MKKNPLALVLIALTGSLHGQMLEVTSSGVGIGTSTPSQLLEISSASSNAWEVLRRPGTSTVAVVEFMTNSTADWSLGTVNNSTSDFNLFNYGTSSSALTVLKGSGNVGIGVSSPADALEVGGDVRIHTQADGQALKLIGRSPDNFSQLAFRNNADSAYTGLLQCQGDGTFVFVNASPLSERMRIDSAGNVGIGTPSSGYKLEVAGSVRATSFISNSTTYADFVFKPGYQLRPLADVEAAIQRDGHLPDIASEAEAKAHGIDLAAQQVKLLQKVEELTLYTIDLEKRLRAVEKENLRLRTGKDGQP